MNHANCRICTSQNDDIGPSRAPSRSLLEYDEWMEEKAAVDQEDQIVMKDMVQRQGKPYICPPPVVSSRFHMLLAHQRRISLVQ